MNKNDYDELNLKKFKMESILPDATVLLLGKRRSGKCLLKGTGVLMADGSIKQIENIQIGDLVMGDDSKSRTVLSLHNGYDTMYKITNQFNESYSVNSQHILSLKCTFESKITSHNGYYKIKWFDKNKLKVVTRKVLKKNLSKTNWISESLDENIINIPIERYMKLPNKVKKFLYGYQKPILFDQKKTEISPYLYGLLLNNNYTHTTNSKILKYLNGELPKYNSYLYYDTHVQCYKINGFINEYMKKNPWSLEYVKNSRTVRLSVLFGILEINNYFNRGFYEVNIHDSSNIDNIIFMIKSIGFSVYTFQKNNYLNIFLLQPDQTNPQLSQFFFNFEQPEFPSIILNNLTIENIGINEYYGIEIDKNSLFMLDNCIVTHNSWLVRDIFYHHKHIPSGIVFSGTEEANPFFSDFVPDSFIHTEYNSDLIEKIMNKQKKKINDAKKSGIKDGKCPANNMFIVFDDMLHDAQNWKNEKVVKNIFFNGRHYNFLFILTMQYALAIPPALRSNIDYVFIFNEQSVKNRRKIYEDYAAMIPSFDIFCNILDACTQNHECLVIKTTGNSADLRDNVFWYKAKAHENFRAGHYKFWNFHKTNYNKNYEDEQLDQKERIDELKEKFSRTKKLKVIVSRDDHKIIDVIE